MSINSVKHDWNEFRLLSGRERRLLLQAIVFLPLIGAGLLFLNFQRLRAVLKRFLPVPLDAAGEDASDLAAGTARLVRAAAARMPFTMTCLVRSTTLWWLLGRRGIDSEIRIGVNLDNGEFHSHAWVEIDNIVLNDRVDVHSRYAAFEQITTPEGA